MTRRQKQNKYENHIFQKKLQKIITYWYMNDTTYNVYQSKSIKNNFTAVTTFKFDLIHHSHSQPVKQFRAKTILVDLVVFIVLLFSQTPKSKNKMEFK